jgi:hypothetical protein
MVPINLPQRLTEVREGDRGEGREKEGGEEGKRKEGGGGGF